MVKRILIVGTSGAGKSTVAKKVAAQMSLDYYASDDFYWQHDWEPAPVDQVNRLLDAILVKPSWVLDGNFEDRWQDVWNRADQIVWLDYSLPRVLWQVASRNLGWFLSRRLVWSGNRMTLHRAISGIRHSLRSHGRKRRAYPQYIAQLRHDRVVRLSSRQQTDAWVSSLAPDTDGVRRPGRTVAA